METKPLASVQMLTYNHAPYVRKAIEGVLAQKTDFPFELIIGEDCSTDGTREVAFEYEKLYPDRVRVVTSDKNVGMHQNSLRMQHACRGEYLAFCEGDDLWHDPAKLQTQVEFMAEHPDYGMTHCNYHSYEVATGRLRPKAIVGPEPPSDDNAYEQVMLRQRRILTLTVSVRRELLEKVTREHPECSDPQWPMGDTQRWFEVCRLAKVKYFPQAMATHNFLPESASQSRNPEKAFRFTEKAGQLILHYLEKYPIAAEHDRKVRRRVGMELLAAAYQGGLRDKAGEWFEHVRRTPGPVPIDAYLYLLGTQGAGRELAAKPAIWFLNNCRRVRDRLARVCAS